MQIPKQIELQSKKSVRSWLSSYQKLISHHFPKAIYSNLKAPAKLYSINILELEGLIIPEIAVLDQFQVSLKFSVTLYSKTANKFISRTYQSHMINVNFYSKKQLENSIELNEDDQEDESPQILQNNIQHEQPDSYCHEPIWVGFYGDEKLDLREIQAVIEISEQYVQKEISIIKETNILGFSMINLQFDGNLSHKHHVYNGSARDVLQKHTQKEQPYHLQAELECLPDLDNKNVIRLIGRHILFGKGDSVHGLREKLIPLMPDELEHLELEEPMEVSITNLTIKVHKAVEIDLLSECDELYQKQYRQFNPTKNQINEFKVRQIQIVSHNAWKAINNQEYENSYILVSSDSQAKDHSFWFYRMSNWQAKVDHCFLDTIILFQIIFETDFILEQIGRQGMSIYIGWCAIPVRRIYDDNGETQVCLEIIGSTGRSFDRKGYFSKQAQTSPGKLFAKLKLSENYLKIREEEENQIIYGNIFKDGQNKQKSQSNIQDEEISLKERLIQINIEQRNAIKNGFVQDAHSIQQEQQLQEIQKSKLNSHIAFQEVYQYESNNLQRFFQYLQYNQNLRFIIRFNQCICFGHIKSTNIGREILLNSAEIAFLLGSQKNVLVFREF